ncbi:MAG: ADOP family duplicated permease [Gammaproteobacteria bacterium]
MNSITHSAAGLIRILVRKPGFALAVILTLTLGIGANTATLSLLYGYLLAPLPYAHPERLVSMYDTFEKIKTDTQMSFPTYFDLRSQTTVFDAAGMYEPKNLNLAAADRVLHVRGEAVTASMFTTLGVHPRIGRVFASAANQPGAAGEVVLSYRLWSELFNRNPAVLGQTVQLNNVAYTVIGVMPKRFKFPNPEVMVWIPKVITPLDRNPIDFAVLNGQMIARLKPGASLATVEAQARAVVAREIAHFPYPGAIPLLKKYGISVSAKPLRSSLVGHLRSSLLLVQMAAGLLLVLVWFNLANLFIARALTRRGELILRRVLGADTRRLFGQLFAESLILCVVGSATGLVFGEVLLRLLLQSGFRTTALAFPVREWGVSAGIALALALVSALVFSLAGLYFIRRQDLAHALREGDTRASGGGAERRIRAGLVVTQLVLACALTGVGAMLARSLLKLGSVDLGFQPQQVVTFQIHLPVNSNTPTPPDIAPVLSRIHAALAQVPGVSQVTVTSNVPFNGRADAVGDGVFPYPWDRKRQPTAFPITTDAAYFKVFGMPLLAGRRFTPQDAIAQEGVAVIDTETAQQLFGTTNAVGREFSFEAPNVARPGFFYKVIGVVGAAHRAHVGQPIKMDAVYLDRSQALQLNSKWFMRSTWYVAVRTPLATAAILPALREAVARVIPNVPFYDVRTMDERLSAHLAPRRGLMRLVLLCAVGALLLAAVGLYAVQSYSVNQRLREFGIRAALGADRSQLLSQVLKEIGRLLAVGLLLGLLGMVALGHLFASALYGVSPVDPLTVLLVLIVLSLTVLLAGWVPAWRASRVPPMRALRDG